MLELERRLAQGSLSDMLGVVAERQTQGRGRLQRSWHTGAGENLAVSYWVGLEAAWLPPLPLVVSLAVVDSLEKSCGLRGRLRCKWPNDIQAEGRKLGGILCQYQAATDKHPEGAIVGVGLNLGFGSDELRQIEQPATSVLALTGAYPPPKQLAAVLQQQLRLRVGRLRNEGFVAQAEEWYFHCAHAGQLVTVNDGFFAICGRTQGLAPSGALILDCQGERREIICGDVSLRFLGEGEQQQQPL